MASTVTVWSDIHCPWATVAVHRLRTRFKECLHQEVSQTVASPGDIEDELRHLLAALST